MAMIDLEQWERRRDRVLVMGIVNVTPDSFYDGGRFARAADAVDHALRLIDEGADIVDIGGESTRPGSRPISISEEMDRVLPVVEAVCKRSPAPVSIDTTKGEVAEEAIARGAAIINDVSALRFDPRMADVAARRGAHVVLMHMQGSPETMQREPAYRDVIAEIRAFLIERAEAAVAAGIGERRILIDPGIGFGKRLDHNLTILRGLRQIAALGRPVVVGLSRKAFLGAILDAPPDERCEATIVANTAAILNGASVIRVHDAKEGRRAADVAVRLRDHVPARC